MDRFDRSDIRWIDSTDQTYLKRFREKKLHCAYKEMAYADDSRPEVMWRGVVSSLTSDDNVFQNYAAAKANARPSMEYMSKFKIMLGSIDNKNYIDARVHKYYPPTNRFSLIIYLRAIWRLQ
jgi:hypothetical protein